LPPRQSGFDSCLLAETAAAIAAANANWDKAAEHAARCAPYLYHKLVAVERSPNRKLCIGRDVPEFSRTVI
jgi:hypothetical protein